MFRVAYESKHLTPSGQASLAFPDEVKNGGFVSSSRLILSGRVKMDRRDRDRERDGRDGRDRGDRDRDRYRDRDRDRDDDRHATRERRRSRSPRDNREGEREDLYRGDQSTAPAALNASNGDDYKGQSKKREPISIEDRLKELRESKEAVTKPQFLTKEQRQQLALKRLDEQRQDVVKKREEMLAPDRDKERERRERQEKEAAAAAAAAESAAAQEVLITDKELNGIKVRYLGEGKKKKKVVKMSDKFRFAFDWEAGEDTSKDLNPLYNKKHDAQLLFGRGLRAGIDMREQKKNSTYVEQLEAVRAKRQDEVGNDEQVMVDEESERMMEEERRRMEVAYANRAKAGTDKSMKLPGRHWQEKKLAEMTERDWRIFREDFKISTRGGKVPNPIRSWEESELPAEIMSAVKEKGYKMPSPIQMQCIPLGLNNRDVVGVAQTGSGKTAAFVLPMLVYISKQPKITLENAGEGPQSLVLAPSRELALQIFDESVTFCKHMNLRCFPLIGGGGVKSIEDQGFQIRQVSSPLPPLCSYSHSHYSHTHTHTQIRPGLTVFGGDEGRAWR